MNNESKDTDATKSLTGWPRSTTGGTPARIWRFLRNGEANPLPHAIYNDTPPEVAAALLAGQLRSIHTNQLPTALAVSEDGLVVKETNPATAVGLAAVDPVDGLVARTESAPAAGVEQEAVDPIDGLVARTQADPAAAFAPEVLERLSVLRRENVGAFETLRRELKRAGVRVGQLDRVIPKDSKKGGGKSEQQFIGEVDQLLVLAAPWLVFHNSDNVAFAQFDVGEHKEVCAIKSKVCSQFLRHLYFEETAGAPSMDALQKALNTLEARAIFSGPEMEVFVRVAEQDGKHYIDLGDADWRVIEITQDGWQVLTESPVKFRRSRGMQALPAPERGGSVADLRRFLNVGYEHFVLAVAWLLASLRSRGPYPMLVVAGEQGSAKSTFMRVLRALVDPNRAAIRALPREDRDLFVSALHGHVLAFDNVSILTAWLSDALCQLVTGGGYAGRALYTDQDEVILDAIRPIIANGIIDFVTKPDLADRAIFVHLTPIPEENRVPEEQLWAGFEAARPRILGALLDAFARGLHALPEVTLPSYPRMADFARWVVACEGQLWTPGDFWAAYHVNRRTAIENVIDANPVAAAVRALMTEQPTWVGTATELLPVLGKYVVDTVRRSRSWPESPRSLAGALRRAQTALRTIGIEIEYRKVGRTNDRMIFITKRDDDEPEQLPALPAPPVADRTSHASGADGDSTLAAASASEVAVADV